MTQTRYPQHLFTPEQKRERIKIKRAVLKLVRANPSKMTTMRLTSAICGKSQVWISDSLIRHVIWGMVDRDELILTMNRKWNLGPRAPKFRKK